VLSPLLANIALSVIEERYRDWVRRPESPELKSDGIRLAAIKRDKDRKAGRTVFYPVRYADDHASGRLAIHTSGAWSAVGMPRTATASTGPSAFLPVSTGMCANASGCGCGPNTQRVPGTENRIVAQTEHRPSGQLGLGRRWHGAILDELRACSEISNG
jgi:hypothetical protein